GCFKSCEIAENTDRGVWLELCHSPDDCRDSTDVCTSQPGLVSSASACYPSGSVRKPDASVREGGTADASSTGTTRDATVAEARESGTRDSSTSNEEGVTCGALHCPAGRMCCVLEPGTSYCAPYADGCSCSGPRASHADADVEASAGGAGAGDRDATDTDTD
ncbi:MAG TPA: hypothetical protein VH062_37405, partial [Polyangiaceae bacterium]|nr:hypothetical protein [Polyangiaceae bacterium]